MKKSVFSFSKLLLLLVFLLAGSSLFASETDQKRDLPDVSSDSFKSAPSKIFLPEKLNEHSLLQKAEEGPSSKFKFQDQEISFKLLQPFSEEVLKNQKTAANCKELLSRQIFPFHFFW